MVLNKCAYCRGDIESDKFICRACSEFSNTSANIKNSDNGKSATKEHDLTQNNGGSAEETSTLIRQLTSSEYDQSKSVNDNLRSSDFDSRSGNNRKIKNDLEAPSNWRQSKLHPIMRWKTISHKLSIVGLLLLIMVLQVHVDIFSNYWFGISFAVFSVVTSLIVAYDYNSKTKWLKMASWLYYNQDGCGVYLQVSIDHNGLRKLKLRQLDSHSTFESIDNISIVYGDLEKLGWDPDDPKRFVAVKAIFSQEDSMNILILQSFREILWCKYS